MISGRGRGIKEISKAKGWGEKTGKKVLGKSGRKEQKNPCPFTSKLPVTDVEEPYIPLTLLGAFQTT